MLMHDWTRVTSGTFHNFHYCWLAKIMDRLLPLFLDAELYVMVPLEETYQATWNVLPQILRDLVAPREKAT